VNAWCEILSIAVPSLRSVRGHPEANTFALLLVALLERGEPMTLEDVARRFKEAGIASAPDALRSLKRCRPARPPVYRDGDRYEVDPYSDELDLWAFRLGLRPPEVGAPPPPPSGESAPLPDPEHPLTPEELDEAFRDAYVWNWSALRMAMAVLDAHGGRLPEHRIFESLDRMGTRHALRADAPGLWRGRGVTVAEDGDWVLDPADPSIPAMRAAVRKRVKTARRHRASRPDPAVQEARQRAWKERRQAHAAEMAALRRAVLYAAPFPGPDGRPAAVTLLDVASREATTWIGDEVAAVEAALASYDVVAALDVRPLLRSLGVEPRARRLADLSPPQKSFRAPSGRTVKITAEMLVRGSCGIPRPFADVATLRRMMEGADHARLRRRMEATARSLLALYEYGRLHGAVRVRRRGLDETFRVPWVHRVETRLYGLMQEAAEGAGWMEVVLRPTRTEEDPWAEAELCRVVPWPGTRWRRLVGVDGYAVDERDVQRARVPAGSLSLSLRILAQTPPWEMTGDRYPLIRRALEDRAVPEQDRLLAIALAGDLTAMRDDLAEALLRIAEDAGEPDTIRAGAVIALGPALEEADMQALDGAGDASISGRMFRHVQATLRRLYHDPDVPLHVRRRVLEASVRAQAPWHEGAVRAALRSGDPAWRLTAIFCAQYVPGFADAVLEALRGADPDVRFEAIRAAGNLGLKEAEGPLNAMAEDVDRNVAEAALDALMQIQDLDDTLDLDDVDPPDDAGDRDRGPGLGRWGGGPGEGGPTFH